MRVIKLTFYGSEGMPVRINPAQIVSFHCWTQQGEKKGTKVYTTESDQPITVLERPDEIETMLQQLEDTQIIRGPINNILGKLEETDAPPAGPHLNFLHAMNEAIPNHKHMLTLDEDGKLVARIFMGNLVQDFILDDDELEANPQLAAELAAEVRKRVEGLEAAQYDPELTDGEKAYRETMEGDPDVRQDETEENPSVNQLTSSLLEAAAGMKVAIDNLVATAEVLKILVEDPEGGSEEMENLWLRRAAEAIRYGKVATHEYNRAINPEAVEQEELAEHPQQSELFTFLQELNQETPQGTHLINFENGKIVLRSFMDGFISLITIEDENGMPFIEQKEEFIDELKRGEIDHKRLLENLDENEHDDEDETELENASPVDSIALCYLSKNEDQREMKERVRAALEYTERAITLNSYQGHASNPDDTLREISAILNGGSRPVQNRMEVIVEAADSMRTVIQKIKATVYEMQTARMEGFTSRMPVWINNLGAKIEEADKAIKRYNELTNPGEPPEDDE